MTASGLEGRGTAPPLVPAIPGRGPLARRELAARLGLIVAGAGVVLAQFAGLLPGSGAEPAALPAVRGAAQVAPGVLRGGEPADVDLELMAEQFRVQAVLNVGGPDIEEHAVTAGLGLDYLELEVQPGEALPPGAAVELARFVAASRAAGKVVYLHDETGFERSVVAGAMLELMRGAPAARVLEGLSAQDRRSLTPEQLLSLSRFAEAVAPAAPPPGDPNPYLAVRGLTW